MRTLITGATGFLGTWVTRAVEGAGHRPRVLVRDATRLSPLRNLQLEVVQGDILDPEALERATRDVDAVIHMAGLVSLRNRDQRQLFEVNVVGTRNVLDAAAQRGVRVLHTSSIGTLGVTREPTAVDECGAGARAVSLRYPYAESKRQSAELALQYARAGLDVCVLLPGNVLGPGDGNAPSTRLVSDYLQGQTRFYLPGGLSFADVRDVATAYVSALERGRTGHSYLLAGVNLSYRELMEQMRELTGLHRVHPSPWPMPQLSAWWSDLTSLYVEHPFEELNANVIQYGSCFNYCDCSKAARELSYGTRPFKTTLRDTIVDLIARGSGQLGARRNARLPRSIPGDDPAHEIFDESLVARIRKRAEA
jgi:dihydroflavonol-4-reductase